MSEKMETNLCGGSFQAQTDALRMAAQTNIATQKNPDLKPFGTPNASIKPA